ncbi:hypothetical protein [Mycolicibacterium brisbanense]|uniref:TIR domain-containing protein n=1 Tax=Mycolicibacterium brisbanense TaxID=146020 RepID=A0A124E133_9MYCO|nr:hypothetical protein [Mycolicibacterium brisbanense]MCV7155854.1 toll-Interleukin receptor [Mycolicibacterium brisbanense]GAS92418.1 uncharacterized protein RMCB_6514 [Mycolicibacterium brisbanense]
MALYSEAEMRQRGRTILAGRNTTASAVLHAIAQRTSDEDEFDIFLSHSYSDAEAILGVYRMFTSQGRSVYVDWIVDDALHRERVDGSTAALLRQRMNQSLSLIYVISATSRSSLWMPWELGYFDGHNGAVGIMKLKGPQSNYPGQEYLELYPAIEDLPMTGEPGRRVTGAVRPDRSRAVTLETFTRGGLSPI